MAVEAYRAHHLTSAQLPMYWESPPELDAFLKERGVSLKYTLEDFRREGEITAPWLARRGKQNEQERGNQ